MLRIINSIYDYSKDENAFIIKLSMKKYLNIFNNFDPYPIRKRDIDQNVTNFLEDCSNDIPFSKHIILEIGIEEPYSDDLETRTKKGLLNYFLYMFQYYKNESRKIIDQSIFYILAFFILATLAFWLDLSNLNLNIVFLKTIMEGISIGSWVFLWEAIAGVLLKNQTNTKLIRTYKRFLNTRIVFINK